ncbi:hypothetical protein ACOSQ4_012510 [Xanthoceras sorbifolium]
MGNGSDLGDGEAEIPLPEKKKLSSFESARQQQLSSFEDPHIAPFGLVSVRKALLLRGGRSCSIFLGSLLPSSSPCIFELLVLAPIRPSDRRLRSAGRDRVFPSSSFSDPLSVREIGEAMKVEALSSVELSLAWVLISWWVCGRV